MLLYICGSKWTATVEAGRRNHVSTGGHASMTLFAIQYMITNIYL
jgi:hypothetical protein